MTEPLKLRGTALRYALTNHLLLHGICSVQDLVDALTRQGFGFYGRPSKVVSDALRWEVRRGRVWPRGRALYGPGEMPRSTEHRIGLRVLRLREEAALRCKPGTEPPHVLRRTD